MNQAVHRVNVLSGHNVVRVIGIVVVIMVLFYYLFSDRLMRMLLEHELSQQYGAEVNIDGVSHRLLPLQVKLTGVQATDPKKPKENLVDIQMLNADVAWQPLFSKQVVINRLEITDVRFATERETAGQVLRRPSQDKTLNHIKQQIPTLEELISRSPLKSTQVVRTLTEGIEQAQQLPVADIKARISAQAIAQYKQELAMLSNKKVGSASDVGQLISQVQTLTQRLKDDTSVVRAFIDQASTAQQQLSTSYDELEQAIKEDTQLLSSLWAGNPNDTETVIKALLADQAVEVIAAYRKLLNLLSDQKKTEIPFSERQMTFWVKNLEATVQLLNRELQLNAKNITDFHPQLNLTTEYQVVSLQREDQKQEFRLSGQLAVIEIGMNAQTDWQIEQASLPVTVFRLPLSKHPLDMSLLSGLLSSRGEVKIEGNKLNGFSDIQLSRLRIQQNQANEQLEDNINLLANALSHLNSMNLSTAFGGTATTPTVNITSDIFSAIQDALTSSLVEDPQLRQQITAKLLEHLQLNEQELINRGELAQLTQLLAELQGGEKQLELLVKQAIQSNTATQPEKILQGLKGLFN